MKTDIVVAAGARSSRGKNEARRLRVSGKIPAVVYGAGGDPVPVSISPKDITKILRSKTGQNTIFNLAVTDGATDPVMLADWQSDPIKGYLLHVDLKRIDMTKRLTVKIPVHTDGDPVGVKVQGGLLEVVNREITIECLPDDIPDEFRLDVSQLNIGQSVRASDIPLTGSMVLVSSPDAVLSHVVALRASTATEGEEAGGAAPAAGAAAEPEVIKKGKKEEEAADDKGKKK
jgi:large subunit ribosomal protein L25